MSAAVDDVARQAQCACGMRHTDGVTLPHDATCTVGIFWRAWRTALQQVAPERAVRQALEQARWHTTHRDAVLAVGKAAAAMLAGVPDVARAAQTLVVQPAGVATHATGSAWLAGAAVGAGGYGAVLASSHPVPSASSVSAAMAAQTLVAAVPATGRLLVLVSGGTSALLAAPAAGLTLAHKRDVCSALMARGIGIADLNVVRAALSRLKAGQLTRGCAGPVTTLAISDVPDDDISVIGSGPTIGPGFATRRSSHFPPQRHAKAPPFDAPLRLALPHATLIAQAQTICQRHQVAWPADGLRPHAALDSHVPHVRSRDCATVVLGRNALADALIAALAQHAPAHNAGPLLDGDQAEAVQRVRDVAARLAPGQWALVTGEPQRALPANAPPGGRMRDFAAAWLCARPSPSYTLFALASDGVDGTMVPGAAAAAGAIIDSQFAVSLDRAEVCAAHAHAAAGALLARYGAVVHLGPTGQNLADLVVIHRHA